MPAKPNHSHADRLRRKYKYIGILENIANNTGRSLLEVFCSFAKLSACALSLGQREEEYMGEIKRWSKEDVELFSKALAKLIIEAEDHPYKDILGEFYIALKYKARGEFYTPYNLCECMGAMASPTPKAELTRVAEPCCGAGQMILGLAKQYYAEKIPLYYLIVEAQDIDATACDMCYINTTLWGIPTIVRHGNSLTMEVWAEYPNIHYIRAMDYWGRMKMVEKMRDLINTTSTRAKSKLEQLRSKRRPKMPKNIPVQKSIMDFL